MSYLPLGTSVMTSLSQEKTDRWHRWGKVAGQPCLAPRHFVILVPDHPVCLGCWLHWQSHHIHLRLRLLWCSCYPAASDPGHQLPGLRLLPAPSFHCGGPQGPGVHTAGPAPALSALQQSGLLQDCSRSSHAEGIHTSESQWGALRAPSCCHGVKLLLLLPVTDGPQMVIIKLTSHCPAYFRQSWKAMGQSLAEDS